MCGSPYMGLDDAILWQESHASVLTNQFGNLALTIGDGAVTPGYDALSAIDWSAAGLHFGIEVDAGSGYASFGSVDVEAVPVAMYALNGQEEEIAALQGALDALDGDVDSFVDDLSAAIVANAAADAAESAEGDDADDALQANIDAAVAASEAADAAQDAAAADALLPTLLLMLQNLPLERTLLLTLRCKKQSTRMPLLTLPRLLLMLTLSLLTLPLTLQNLLQALLKMRCCSD